MALRPPFKPCELLYFTSDPTEIPLVLPPWARRRFPELAEMIDAGLQLHEHGLELAAKDRSGRLRNSLIGDLIGPNPYKPHEED